MREKTILQKMSGSRFVIEIRQTFMDDANLYFVFEHCQYGTLSNLINELGKVKSLTLTVFLNRQASTRSDEVVRCRASRRHYSDVSQKRHASGLKARKCSYLRRFAPQDCKPFL